MAETVLEEEVATYLAVVEDRVSNLASALRGAQ
jgi:hypothetical protein